MRILAIEGQGNFGFVWRQLMMPLVKKFGDKITPTSMEWDGLPPFDPVDVLIGHSLGGHKAIRAAATIGVKYLITLDPRWMSNWGWLDIAIPWQQDFVAPDGIKCFNFTHSPPILFPGYDVKGAVNQSLICTHFNIAAQPEVFATLSTIIEAG